MDEIENMVKSLWESHSELLQLKYGRDGVMTVWFATDVLAMDMSDPTAWISDSAPLDQIGDPGLRASVTKLLDLILATELPEGYIPHIWFRPPSSGN